MIIRWTPDELEAYRRRAGGEAPADAPRATTQQRAAAAMSAQRERSSAPADLEGALNAELLRAKLGPYERNYRFDARRRWELDFAWLVERVAIEVQGGVQSYGRVGHTRPEQYQRDTVKTRAAQLMGWIVLPCTAACIRDGSIVADVETALELRRPHAGRDR